MNIFPDKTPKIPLKLAAKAGQELLDWLEGRAIPFRKKMHGSNGQLAATEKKRAAVAEEIAKLEKRAEEASAAEKLPALQVQLPALERKIEELGASEFGDPIRVILSELTPIMRKAMTPVLNAEVQRMAEPLLPYFRSQHRALQAVRNSDWYAFLAGIYLNSFERMRTLDGAIHVVECLLRQETPYPYDPNPTDQDKWIDAQVAANSER